MLSLPKKNAQTHSKKGYSKEVVTLEYADTDWSILTSLWVICENEEMKYVQK